MRTVADKIIVAVSNVKEQKLGSIFLVSELDQPIVSGTVLVAGPDVKVLKVGDKVTFEKGFGVEVGSDQEKALAYLVMREENVLAIQDE